MANMKKRSTLFKTVMKEFCILLRMTEMKMTDNIKCQQGYGETGTHTLLLGM